VTCVLRLHVSHIRNIYIRVYLIFALCSLVSARLVCVCVCVYEYVCGYGVCMRVSVHMVLLCVKCVKCCYVSSVSSVKCCYVLLCVKCCYVSSVA